jgi:NADPH-dependent 2,4-dienoyl-CoA reductase/sulfur reductase-like enzyme
MKTSVLIIGGSDAGISAALRARELDAAASITVVMADRFPNYSICGLPFYLSGEVPDWHHLAHRTEKEITEAGIHLLLDHTASAIDPVSHRVWVSNAHGHEDQLSYDRLILATGAVPSRPTLSGLNLPGVYLLRTMEESFLVEQHLASQSPRRAVIIGGGYIGLEMADALTRRGIKVTVIEHHASVLKTIDASLGKLVQEELERHNVEVIAGVQVERITSMGAQLQVRGTHGYSALTDLVLVAVGVQPETALAPTAQIRMGIQHAICVTRKMETNVPDIFAAGDCVETWHRLLKHPTYLPLGTTAHKQGRVAGANAVGRQAQFAGTLGTQVVKVFDLAIARTGLRDDEAVSAGFDPLTAETSAWDHKAYYPGAHRLCLRITGDRTTGRLLGAQMVGHVHGEVAKRIDVFATALFHDMSVDMVSDLDLSYTPPLSSPWDPVQIAAQNWVAQHKRGISPR